MATTPRSRIASSVMLFLTTTIPILELGCAGGRTARGPVAERAPILGSPIGGGPSVPAADETPVVAATHEVESNLRSPVVLADDEVDVEPATPPAEASTISADDVRGLVASGLAANPRLARMRAEAEAAWARVPQVEALPDPMLGANVFAAPIETAAGSQRANLSLNQKLPYLKRLRAEGQRAAYTAMAHDHLWQAEALRLTGDVRAAYFAIYLVDRRLTINETNTKELERLIETATQLVGQGKASVGDVHLGTVELGKLAEERIELRRRRVELVAGLNALLNRPSDTPVTVVTTLDPIVPDLDTASLRYLAHERQPEIAAAHLRTNAADWGLRAADLADVPDVTVGFTWYGIEDNRPPSPIVDVGEDAWSVGASINVPLWRDKYRAMECEAVHRWRAARLGVDEVRTRYDAVIADVVERARAADETAELYRETILPKARETLETDLLAYGQNRVEFDRVIRDFRNLVTLEVGYHRAVANLATAIARLEQAVGVEFAAGPITETIDDTDPAVTLPAPDDAIPRDPD